MNLFEDKVYMKEESDIKAYFEDNAVDLFECGQGYAQEEATAYAKIGSDYYLVDIMASIDSAKQNRGDRLYWVEEITSVISILSDRDSYVLAANESTLNLISNHEKSISNLKKKLIK